MTQLNSPIKQTHENADWTLVACEGNRPPSFVQIAQRLLSGRLCISDSVSWPASAVLHTAYWMLQRCLGTCDENIHKELWQVMWSMMLGINIACIVSRMARGYLQRISNKSTSWHLFHSDFNDIRWHGLPRFLGSLHIKSWPAERRRSNHLGFFVNGVNKWDVPELLGCSMLLQYFFN